MQKHYNYLNIDLDKKIHTKLKAKQGDSKSRYILVNLISNSTYYDLSDCAVKIYGIKKDKTIFFNHATVVNGKQGQFEVELTTQALSVPGEIEIQILILGTNQEKLTTFSFFIEVEKTIVDDAGIESTNEFTALTTALSSVQDIDNKFRKVDEQFNTKANKTQADDIQQQVNNLVLGAVGNGNNAEVIQARGKQATLNGRLSDIEKGKNLDYIKNLNLFDDTIVYIGKSLSSDGTSMTENSNFNIYKIPVLPNTDYYVTQLMSARNRVYFWDENDNVLGNFYSNYNYNWDSIIKTPVNAKFIIFHETTENIILYNGFIGSSEDCSKWEKGERFYGNNLSIKRSNIVNSLDCLDIETESDLCESYCKNLFDKNNVTKGFINNEKGQIQANSLYGFTNFIKVTPGKTLYFSTNKNAVGARYITAYTNQKTVSVKDSVIDSSSLTKTYTVPQGIYYVKITFKTEFIETNKLQIEYDSITDYIDDFNNTFIIRKELQKNVYDEVDKLQKQIDGDIKIYLPDTIYVAVGRTIELYNNQVSWCAGNIDDYSFQWVCDIGKAMKRKFSITGTTNLIGSYPLTLNVYNNQFKLVKTIQSKIQIVSDNKPIKSICPIGDSLTNSKEWLAEIQKLSDKKISFVGKIPYSILLNGETYTGGHEGRSGFSAYGYTSDRGYQGANYGGINEDHHAFWNPSTNRFDWNYYKSTVGVNPDAVQIWLGINGISLDNSGNYLYIKTIIDKIRQDDSSIPIFLVNTIYRSNQNGIGNQQNVDGYSSFKGSFKKEEDLKVFNLMVKLSELSKLYNNFHIIPCALTFDSENNFGVKEVTVNPRSEIKEIIPTDSIHPVNYLQIADAMYSTYCATL